MRRKGRRAFVCGGSGAAALLLMGWPARLPAETPVKAPAGAAPSTTPVDWRICKELWQSLHRQDRVLLHAELELAACFGEPVYRLEDLVRNTEMTAAGRPGNRRVLEPSWYALSVFMAILIDTLPAYDGREPVPLTRMVYIPPGERDAHRLDTMTRLPEWIEELRKQVEGPDADAALETLAVIRAEVYRHRALRMAAEIHRKFHPKEWTLGSQKPEAIPSTGRGALRGFLQDPGSSPVGTARWLQAYTQAAGEFQRRLKRPEAGTLRKQQEALIKALERLEAARPSLEAMIADLER